MALGRLGRLPAGRRTNLALLAFVVSALATGGVAFAIGTSWVRWVLVAHGSLGLGIVLLSPWKSAVSMRGLRRRRPGAGASIALALDVVVVIATGLGHATGLLRTVAGVTSIQIHVGAALVSVPLVLWHVLARPVRPRRTDISRRSVLRAGAVLGGSILAYGTVEGLVHTASLPGEDRRFTGSFEAASLDPASMPVTQWLDDSVLEVEPAKWRLLVRAGNSERAWTLQELLGFDDRVRATLDCTGGWYSEQMWEGVLLSRLLSQPGDARSVVAASATGYTRRYPIADGGPLLVATRLGGRPLSSGHGFPARLVAPGRRGFWWVKWVERIETSPTPWWWQPPFPVT